MHRLRTDLSGAGNPAAARSPHTGATHDPGVSPSFLEGQIKTRYHEDMHASRHSRLTAALIALCSMLFMQLAVASYVCPTSGIAAFGAKASAPSEAVQQAMPGCADMDMEQPSLCHAHEQVGTQSLDKPDLPQVQPFTAVGLSRLLLPAGIILPASVIANEVILTRATAPPLSIRHCCFRI